ncbi:MAG: hypothetical protein FRX48_04556 [Lasallia pustulata]|uniref:Uncharacterized protein n=1 Tax=Lasallia pustulata TaxID=136370 RepID=A0A5M8PP07_9LECA|nr:MAG: hypothetical protein FRX48_04556 [Lasallia pustulata]
MPRPKRSKVAPSSPTARVLKPVATSILENPSPRSSARTNGSDDSDGLVTRKSTTISMHGLAKQEYTMSGALDPRELRDERARPPTARQRAALSKIAREADHSRAIEALKKRREAALAAQGGDQIQVPSSQPTKPTEGARPPTRARDRPAMTSAQALPSELGSQEQNTPAMESSMLAIAKFKRRPRQPSILQLVQQQDNHAKEQGDDEDLDDFLPDDESTPFLVSKTKPRIQDTPTLSSPSSEHLPTLDQSRKRKLTSPDIQVPRSQSLVDRPTTPTVRDLGISDTYSIPGDEPELPTRHLFHAPSPQFHSDTLAPPQSSSPLRASPQHKRPTRNRPPAKSLPRVRAGRKNPGRKTVTILASDPEEPPPEASEHPSPAQPSQKRNVLAPKTLSSATLQNLLPRRRHHRRHAGEFDIPSSGEEVIDTTGLDEDQDELSHVAIARRVVVKKNPAKTPGSKKRVANATVGKKTVQAKGKGPTRTYARKVSDKENKPRTTSEGGEQEESLGPVGDDDDAGDAEGEAGRAGPTRNSPSGTELQRLAEYFREVDKFALNFVEDKGSSSRSSQRDWR